jgi:threonine synthase
MRDLVCVDCGKTHPPSTARCPCSGPLDPVDPLDPIGPDVLEAPLTRSRLRALVPHTSEITSLGAGLTPTIADDELGAIFKNEGPNPTGSFKDRGAENAIGAARELGVDRVTEDSSGNAGAAIAAHAARAGIACNVFTPEHASETKLDRMRTLGATVDTVEAPRSQVTERAVDAASAEGAYYASHTYPPHFVEGCTPMAVEIAARHDPLPDTIVTPCAMGSIVLGLHRGFDRLVRGGAIDEPPRIVAVQAAGYDPIARALDNGLDAENTLADGLLVPQPPRQHQLVDAIEATDGTALAVDREATRQAMQRLHRRGLLVEPSSATSLAAVETLREVGELGDGETPLAILTGAWSPG